MEEFNIKVEERVVAGKAEINRLKKEGMVPGMLYGQGENVPVALGNHELKTILDRNGDDIFLNLNLHGRQIKSRMQEVQRDPITREIKHIDLISTEDLITIVH